MIHDQIERNLLLFLDPSGEKTEVPWHFVSCLKQIVKSLRSETENETNRKIIFCFDRREIVEYLLFPWFAKKHGFILKGRKVLFMNDGLLSSFFDADKTAGYRMFAADHLPVPTSLRQRLVSLIPLTLKAEKRYVIVGQCNEIGDTIPGEVDSILDAQDIMFFSNAAGKLLLTSAETLRSGKGLVIKTTACPTYAKVLEKEFTTMFGIAEIQGETAFIPRAGKRFQIGKRIFFTEEYVKGKSLRDVLHVLSRRNDIASIRTLLDRLDDWFEKYRAFFKAEPKSLISCYEHLFNIFTELYGEYPQAGLILAKANEAMDEITRKNVKIVPIMAHNDLWPGNFVVGTEGLVAVDWERAIGNRAPMFDYYWMIISAVLESLVCGIGIVDYSGAFRLFLEEGDDITCHAVEVLKTFLGRLGLDKELHQCFMLLFLMEWSVQGYLALGSRTSMDGLAFDELANFVDTSFGRSQIY